MACERHENPVFDERNKRAWGAFWGLANGITRDFPGAWDTYFRWTPILVEDEWEARYYLRAWADFYQAVQAIAEEKAKAQSRAEERMNQRARLRIGT